jgi:hypothetical protein
VPGRPASPPIRVTIAAAPTMPATRLRDPYDNAGLTTRQVRDLPREAAPLKGPVARAAPRGRHTSWGSFEGMQRGGNFDYDRTPGIDVRDPYRLSSSSRAFPTVPRRSRHSRPFPINAAPPMRPF